MAVQEQTPIIEYIANGSTNIFPITFDIHSTEDLGVLINGELALEASYQVQDNSVVFMVIPPSGSAVTLFRDTEKNRLTDYKSYDNSFRPSAINWDLDKLWHVLQEQNLVDAKILARLKQEIEWRRTHDFNYDELAQVREKQLFDALKGYTDTLNAATNPGVFQGVIAGVVFARDGKSIQTHLEEILEALVQERENINLKADKSYVDGQLDLKANQDTTYSKTEVDSALSEVDSALSAVAAGHKAYTTLALAQAAQGTLPANTIVEVTNDPTASNNGTYQWSGTTLTKSAYDPLTQAKAYSDEKTIQDINNSTDIFKIVDVNGKVAVVLKTDGRLFVAGLDTDLLSKLNALDVSNLITTSSASTIFEIKDIEGNTTVKQLANGDLLLPSIGNLTTLLSGIESRNTYTGLQAAHSASKPIDHIIANNQDYFASEQVILTADDVKPVFSHDVEMVRIPAITRIGKTKYLLFFEARETEDDFGRNSQGVATLDVDLVGKSVSVSNIQALHEAFTDTEGKLRTFMNACAVKLNNGRIICLYVRRYSTTEHQLYMRTSDDNGVTWSAYTDISAVKNVANINLLCPTSQGLVKRFGKHKGRIVFPVWSTDATYDLASFRSGYMYSDDDGVTWNLGEFASYPTANEVQIAEDLNGDMLFSIRLENRTPPKVLARLSDKTKTYTDVATNVSLTDEAIMSGFIQADNTYDDSANKFMMSTCKNRNRTELLIHTSYDGGNTWRSYLLPSTTGQSVAYSCIENITPEFKFLLWESSSNFKASVVALKNLININ